MRSRFALPSLFILVALALLAGAVLRHPSPLPTTDAGLRGTRYRVGLWAYVWQTGGAADQPAAADGDDESDPDLSDATDGNDAPDLSDAAAPLYAVALRGLIAGARSALGPAVETQSGHIDRLLILLFQVAPFGLALVVYRRWLERRRYPEGTVLFCVAAAAFGTLLGPATVSLNLYGPAAVVVWLLLMREGPADPAPVSLWRRHGTAALGCLAALAIHPLAIGPALVAVAARSTSGAPLAPSPPDGLPGSVAARLTPYIVMALVAGLWLGATGGLGNPFPFLSPTAAPVEGATFLDGAVAATVGVEGFFWLHPIVFVALAGMAGGLGSQAARLRGGAVALAGTLALGFSALLHRDGFHGDAMALALWWVPFWLPLLPDGHLALCRRRGGRALAALCLAAAIVTAGFALAGATAERPAGPFGVTLVRQIGQLLR